MLPHKILTQIDLLLHKECMCRVIRRSLADYEQHKCEMAHFHWVRHIGSCFSTILWDHSDQLGVMFLAQIIDDWKRQGRPLGTLIHIYLLRRRTFDLIPWSSQKN
jgi:hypothetical protein